MLEEAIFPGRIPEFDGRVGLEVIKNERPLCDPVHCKHFSLNLGPLLGLREAILGP